MRLMNRTETILGFVYEKVSPGATNGETHGMNVMVIEYWDNMVKVDSAICCLEVMYDRVLLFLCPDLV